MKTNKIDLKDLAIKIATGQASEEEKKTFDAVLEKPENEELKKEFINLTINLDTLDKIKADPSLYQPPDELPQIENDSNPPALQPIFLNQIYAINECKAAYQNVLATANRESEILAVAADLAVEELKKTIKSTQSARSEACKEYLQSHEKLHSTFNQYKSFLAKERDTIIANCPSKSGEEFESNLVRNTNAQNQLESNRKEIEEDKKTVLFIGSLAVKNIRKVSLVDFEGRYIAADWNIGNTLIADRSKANAWEIFSLVELNENRIILFSFNRRLVCADQNIDGLVVANRRIPGYWELFELVKDKDAEGFINIRASNGKYLSSRMDEGKKIRACADLPSTWERFQIESK